MKENRVALCLNGTMRGPKNCLPTLYENIIKVWDTDVLICINKQYVDDEFRIEILDRLGARIIEKNIAPQPDLNTWFPKSFYEKLIPLAQNKLKNNNVYDVNYLGPLVGSHSALHVKLNWYKLSFMLEKYLKEYDYFIITRPDHLYLFPIFDKTFLEKENIIHYDEHGWGGINVDFIIIHSQTVIDWLRKPIEYLIEDKLQDILINELNKINLWNSERFALLISELCGWKMKQMSINSFISADSLGEMTAFNPIRYDGKYYYKYDSNYIPCSKNFDLWENGFRWINSKEKITLSKP